MRHAVIMAGGAGTRLWPLSRKRRPKQFMRLFDGASLLALARRRLEGLFEPQNIWVITSAQYLDLVADELPDVPRKNFIGEPMGRDTANAIGLAANILARLDPAATMAVFTADHLISPQEAFAEAIRTGLEAAEQFDSWLVTFGITPDSPHTGYGYIRRGEPVGPGIYRVAEFREKPGPELACQYLASGQYLWNSGMFAWKVRTILSELERHLPQNAAVLAELAADWGRLAGTAEAAERFGALRRISIDYAVMEKAERVLLVEMKCRWMDLGSWLAIRNIRPADGQQNVQVGAHGVVIGGRNNVLISEREHLIVTVGLDNIVVVHSPDATLVCAQDQLERVKEVVAVLGERFGDRYV
jgi:mannose-1-phosphate guanylyltransferase